MSTNEPPPEQPAPTPPPKVPPPDPQYQPYPQQPAGPGVPRPGGLWERFLARLIDGIIVGVGVGIISGIIRSAADGYLYLFLTSVISAAAYLAYFTLLESSRGATLGKQVLKLKVVGPDGASTPTQEQAFRRNIWNGFGIAGVVPVVGAILGGIGSLVAVIMIAVGINGDPTNRQGWHDRFAGGTRVLKIG